MSGLEPLAALGLACNILQLVELGQKTIGIIKTVYQGREPDAELKQNAVVLGRLAKEVESSLSPTGVSGYEEILLQSAASCSTAANKLQKEVYLLFGNAKKGSHTSAVKVAITVHWRRYRLDKLKQNLEMEEKRMQTSLLAQIWYVADIPSRLADPDCPPRISAFAQPVFEHEWRGALQLVVQKCLFLVSPGSSIHAFFPFLAFNL